MEITQVHVDDLIPYENNPRDNDGAVDAVAASIREFGFKVPIVADREKVIAAGHTRLKAAKQLGIEWVPVIIADDLTEEQVKAFRLADNKTGELANWDFAKLEEELADISNIDMSDFGFDDNEEKENDETYTTKSDIPQYEITGEKPDIYELVTEWKTEELLDEIDKSNVTDKEKEFLTKAAYRHTVFDYKKIAEYYATASKEMQELMEKSGLVIIDFDNAIANGYCKLSKAMKKLLEESKNA